MKTFYRFLFSAAIIFSFQSNRGLTSNERSPDQLAGSWMRESGEEEQVLIFIDGYNTHTVYSKSGKKFTETRGGTYQVAGGKLTVTYEFDTRNTDHIGKAVSYDFSVKNNELIVTQEGKSTTYKRTDDGSAPLAGLWSITGRMQEGKIVPIHRTGSRKTIKILSGNRFQWAAIDPGTKQFSGTGGGKYEFSNGKYTEHIEFFSRDSSRVGAALSFDGKLENGEWHHSGLSSKGDNIYEIWSRRKN